MTKGKYQAARKRRKRINWTGVFFWLILLTMLIVGIVLLCRSCGRSDEGTKPVPGASTVGTLSPQPSQSPEGSTPTGFVTEPSVEPTTQPVTEPATEPTTEPTTEPMTEPVTEPTTGPTTEPSEEPDDDPVEEPIVEPEYNSELGQSVAAIAQASVGKPYRHGGEGPDDFDTTGFVAYCFRESGVSAPRGLSSQFEHGAPVPKDALKPGDVVFFSLENPGEAEYVGIYIGDGKFIAVSSSKNAVMERNLGSSYYTERYVGARRYS